MGVKLAFSEWGTGQEPLVLLHGFTGNGGSFDHLQGELGGLVRAIAVDLPGHGKSPLPSLPGRDGFLETIDAVLSLVDSLGVKHVNLLGYSQGARVALAAASHAPERFGRLILESGSPGLHRRQERASRREEDAQWVNLLRGAGMQAFVERWESQPIFHTLATLPEAQKTALSERRRACDAAGLAGALETLGTGVQPDYWPRLHALRVPTLLLTGALDQKFTEIARRMAREIPVVWRHAFDGVGHAPHLEAPQSYAREVLSFLQTPWYEAPAFDAPAPLRRIS